MIVDEKGRLFGKINLLDILIVVIIIGVVVAVAYKLNNSKVITPFTQKDKIVTVLTADEVIEEIASTLNVGESVRDRVTGASFGVVKSIEVNPSISYTSNSNGEIVKSTRPGYKSLIITVEGEGVYSNSNVTFGNNDYYINKQYEIRIDNTSIYFRVQNVTKAEEKK